MSTVNFFIALVVELEYTEVLEASAERIASSSLAQGTKTADKLHYPV